MKVHYWNGKHDDLSYPVACGKKAASGRWPFKFWQQKRWKGVTCGGCLASKKRKAGSGR